MQTYGTKLIFLKTCRRNGADFGVFINTGIMYDGSDAGAKPSEAISWGKLKIDADYVKVRIYAMNL